jgi:5-aminopentanamidase
VKIAAYQAPLEACASIPATVVLIRERVDWCEAEGVRILCCPEAVLGGLADNVLCPADIALSIEDGEVGKVLAPLASRKVVTIVGFTEVDSHGRLFNSAVVLQDGAIAGICRKLYPAQRQSVYQPGHQMPVFVVDNLTFGIAICRDSTFSEPAAVMASKGATVLFVPSHNALKPGTGPELIAEARQCDVDIATANRMFVIRADVAGRAGDLTSFGATGIVSPDGTVLQEARQLGPDLLVAKIEMAWLRISWNKP